MTHNGGLRKFQQHLDRIYGKNNSRLFTKQDIAANLLRYVTRTLKTVRKNDAKKTKENLVTGFAWAIALANSYHLDVRLEIQKRFPGVCPYCSCAPCACGIRRPLKRKIICSRKFHPWTSIASAQKMFSDIYPANVLKDSTIHLAEEMGEIIFAILMHSGRHTRDGFGELRLELVDVFANMFAVATCAGFDLQEALILKFRHGCPWCNKLPCDCSFNGIVKA
ncbi:MAG TPA: hypothetical protein VMR73_00345 [Candidatus Paceibacterota bacterium]|nr:hypothetical protein [Candidatus Paceibacterota bacterium]